MENIEWKNGDECVCEYFDHERNKGDNLIYVSVHPTHKDHSIVYAKYIAVPYFSVPTSMLSKPLSKEEIEKQKADEEIKEIAEFIRSMCVKHRSPKRDEISIDAAKYLHKAGYRKGEL